MTEREGYMPFKGYKTWYRVVGDADLGRVPLLTIHGGPGNTHWYLRSLDLLAERYHRQVIYYDQLSCGYSKTPSLPELWSPELFEEGLVALRRELGLERVHLLGQSWGGMLAITFACDRKPGGLRSLVLSSTLSSSKLWAHEQHRLMRSLPAAEQEALGRALSTGCYDDQDYQRAIDHYMRLHAADDEYGPDAPECLRRPVRKGREAYECAWGMDEATPTGTLADWDYTDRLGEIAVPVLIASGTEDLSTPTVARAMFETLPNVRWELFPGCRHMCFVERTQRYERMLSTWCGKHDPTPTTRHPL